MHLVLGGTGHVGSAVTETLLAAREPVMVLSRSREKAEQWKKRGAEVVVADVHDVAKLRGAIEKSERVYVLNPPGDPSKDASEEEYGTIHAILSALNSARAPKLEKIVAASTYGARAGERLGDLGTLFALEQGLKKLVADGVVPGCEVIRGAYYMSNWDMQLESAKESGEVQSFFPLDFELPMVAPRDLGREAANRMMRPRRSTDSSNAEIVHVEGPNRYTAHDVADAFSRALDKRVRPVHIRQADWITTLMEQLGFSGESANSFAGMFDATVHGRFPTLLSVTRAPTSLDDYVRELVEAERKAA